MLVLTMYSVCREKLITQFTLSLQFLRVPIKLVGGVTVVVEILGVVVVVLIVRVLEKVVKILVRVVRTVGVKVVRVQLSTLL